MYMMRGKVTRSGEFSPTGRFFYFGKFTESSPYFGAIFSTETNMYVLVWAKKNGLGNILGTFPKNSSGHLGGVSLKLIQLFLVFRLILHFLLKT
jgi:hypothetical protein